MSRDSLIVQVDNSVTILFVDTYSHLICKIL